MFRILLLVVFLAFSIPALSDSDRASVAAELTQKAKDAEVLIAFGVDQNDDTTLILQRVSTLAPSELSGDWTFYLYSIGSSPEYLKENGFNKVRIYTSKSKGQSDYVLKIL